MLKLQKLKQKLQRKILVVRTEILEVETQVPVTKIETIETEVPVTKLDVYETEVPVHSILCATTEVPITKIETIETEIPVTKIEVVETEIPVTKIEVIEVDKIIYDKTQIDDLLQQTEKVMGLRDLFKSKSSTLETQHEQMVRLVDTLNQTIQKLSTTVEEQQRALIQIHNTKLIALEDTLTRSNVEKVYVENEVNKELNEFAQNLQMKYNVLMDEKNQLEARLASVENLEDKEKIRFYYRELYNFCFQNISPYTQFDQEEAKHYWDNLIK